MITSVKELIGSEATERRQHERLILKGGNWWNGAYAGLLGFIDPRVYREIVSGGALDIEGLPERWVKILKGETNWIPKIVFKGPTPS